MLWRQNMTWMKRWEKKGKDNGAFLSPCSIMSKTERVRYKGGRKKANSQSRKRRESAWLKNCCGRKQMWEGGNRKEMLARCSHFRCRGNLSAVCVASAQQCASDSPDPGDKQIPKEQWPPRNIQEIGNTSEDKASQLAEYRPLWFEKKLA